MVLMRQPYAYLPGYSSKGGVFDNEAEPGATHCIDSWKIKGRVLLLCLP